MAAFLKITNKICIEFINDRGNEQRSPRIIIMYFNKNKNTGRTSNLRNLWRRWCGCSNVSKVVCEFSL